MRICIYIYTHLYREYHSCWFSPLCESTFFEVPNLRASSLDGPAVDRSPNSSCTAGPSRPLANGGDSCNSCFTMMRHRHTSGRCGSNRHLPCTSITIMTWFSEPFPLSPIREIARSAVIRWNPTHNKLWTKNKPANLKTLTINPDPYPKLRTCEPPSDPTSYWL